MGDADAYSGAEFVATRRMPLQVDLDDPDYNAIMELAASGGLGPVNYFLGGKINDMDEDSMALNPAYRRAIWSVFAITDEARDQLTSIIPNNVAGVYFDHHSPSEPDWRNACWGPHYARLEELKNKYDPNRVLNCWHCPGYAGEEDPAVVSSVERTNSDPSSTPTPSSEMTPSPTPSSSTRKASFTTAQTMCMLVVQ